jgi:hypothetical protein
MRKKAGLSLLILTTSAAMIAIRCGSESTSFTTSGTSSGNSCSLEDNTTAVSTYNGCSLLSRDTSSCQSSRVAQGLTGNWLKFSCRVTLTVSGSNVLISTDSQPDYKSTYFSSSNACYSYYAVSFPDPNTLSAQSFVMTVPKSASAGSGGSNLMSLGVVGVALNGVAIYDDKAAGADNIFDEMGSFDECQGHANAQNVYHYHSEPYAISHDDDNVIGVMRDGYWIYGRNEDGSGTLATSVGTWQTAYGGHVTTPPGGSSSVFHYHANLQTGTDTSGSTKNVYFLTGNNGGSHPKYWGTAGSCSGC